MPKRAEPVNPDTLPRPVGFSHGYAVQGGTTLYLAGQVAHDRDGGLVGAGDLVAQFRQACLNLQALLAARGGGLTDLVKLTLYVRSAADYKARAREIGGVYRELFGKHFPAMTLVEVARLYDDGCLVEIDGIAVVD